MIEKFLKKLPPGTEFPHYGGAGMDQLSLWGGKTAFVQPPDQYAVKYPKPDHFDPERVARAYVVYETDVEPPPVDKIHVGIRADWKYGNKSFFDQPFYYALYGGLGDWRKDTGNIVGEPVKYWVEVDKFSDLSDGETAQVTRALMDKGYVEPRKYTLTAAKWKKLLAMSFDESQAQSDYDLANAADELVSVHAYTAADQWDRIPGVYVLTKKFQIKFVVSRNREGDGL